MFIKTVSIQTKTLELFLPNEILLIIDNFLRTTVFKEKQNSLERIVLDMIKNCRNNFTYISKYLEVAEKYPYNIIYIRIERTNIKFGISCETI